MFEILMFNGFDVLVCTSVLAVLHVFNIDTDDTSTEPYQGIPAVLHLHTTSWLRLGATNDPQDTFAVEIQQQ